MTTIEFKVVAASPLLLEGHAKRIARAAFGDGVPFRVELDPARPLTIDHRRWVCDATATTVEEAS